MKHAAIAQPVERILGKDEVASSNLASSSKKKPRTPTGFRLSSFLRYMVSTPKTDTETDTAIFFILKYFAIIAFYDALTRTARKYYNPTESVIGYCGIIFYYEITTL